MNPLSLRKAARHLSLHSRWIWRSRFLQRQFYTAGIPDQNHEDEPSSFFLNKRAVWPHDEHGYTQPLLLWAEDHLIPGWPRQKTDGDIDSQMLQTMSRQWQDDSFFLILFQGSLHPGDWNVPGFWEGRWILSRFRNEQSSTAFHWVANHSTGSISQLDLTHRLCMSSHVDGQPLEVYAKENQ